MFVDFINQGLSNKTQFIGPLNGRFLAVPLSLYLRDSCPIAVMLFLDLAFKQTNLQKALSGQFWRPEAVAIKAIIEELRGLKG